MAPRMMKPTMTSVHTAGIFADMTVDGPIIGDLVVVIDRARNLPNRKTMGKQDPYCAARLGKEAKKTDTDRRGGQTPKWDQELRFTVHDSPDYYKLKLSTFNDDRKTDLIGETWIDLKDVVVRGGGQHDGWHSLNCKGRSAGEIRMEITYYDTRQREERPVQEKESRQARNTELPSGPRGANVRRRPLPKGPSSAISSIRIAPSSTSTQSIDNTASHRGSSDPRLPRQMSVDIAEENALDPYEHRHRMMTAHGLPFDPHNKKLDDRLTYNGGPRPAPGQTGFSDLEKLSYRNRGLKLPDSPRHDSASDRERTQEGNPRLASYHPSSREQFAAQYELSPSPIALHAMEASAHSVHQDNPRHVSEPLDSDHAYLSHHMQASYVDESYRAPSFAEDTHPFEAGNQVFEPTDFTSEQKFKSQYYPNERQEDTEELPPPPPPPHRSSDGPIINSAVYEVHANTHQDPNSDFSRGLAQLEEADRFYQPPEGLTQLTVQSEPPAPVADNYYNGYNHGHHHQQHFGHAHSPGQPNYANHRRSMQELRPNDQTYDIANIPEDYEVPHQLYSNRVVTEEGHGSRTFRPVTVNTYPHTRTRDFVQPEAAIAYEEMPSQALMLADLYGHTQHTILQDADLQQRQQQQQQQLAYDYDERISHRSSAPLIKPRAVSPRETTRKEDIPAISHPIRNEVARKSVSPSPPVRRVSSPRLSGVAFSPDSFDILNPQVSATSRGKANNGMIRQGQATGDTPPRQVPSPSVEDAIDPDEPIRDSMGRVVDPSDHLPTNTWAPEPEPKKSLKPEIKLRFRGAVPMPTATPRPRRPSVDLPLVKSSVQSVHIMETPASAAQDKEKMGRNKLQKRVRVMMTGGARRNERDGGRKEISVDRGTAMPLQDIPNINSSTLSPGLSPRELRDREVYGRSGAPGAPPIPAKLPFEQASQENSMTTMEQSNNDSDALSREMNGINIGSGGSARMKKTRFATTLM